MATATHTHMPQPPTPLARTLDICRQCGINPDPCQIWAGVVRRHIEGAAETGRQQGRLEGALEENAACEQLARAASFKPWGVGYRIADEIRSRRPRPTQAVRDELDKPKRHAVGYPQ